MSIPSVSSVTVEDDGIDRTVTIVIGEGRKANAYTCEANSLPPCVRTYLLEWLGAETVPAGGGPDGHEATDDAPGVGFRLPTQVTAGRNVRSTAMTDSDRSTTR